jgi:curved DNA-binding protein CbpA
VAASEAQVTEMTLPDYYAVLEVSTMATPGEIKRSYRRLVRLYHPDLNRQNQENQQSVDRQIKLLNEAYKVLGNASSRAAYDEQRRLLREQEARRLRQQLEAQREPKMTWVEGIFGFIRELKKGMRD